MPDQIDLSDIVAELEAITSPDTTGVILITTTATEVKVRACGEKRTVAEAAKAAAEELRPKH